MLLEDSKLLRRSLHGRHFLKRCKYSQRATKNKHYFFGTKMLLHGFGHMRPAYAPPLGL